MRYFFVDASALIKRYHQEPGTAVITRILDDLLTTSPKRVVVPLLGLAEVVAALQRKQNDGRLAPELFSLAAARLLKEMGMADLQSVDDDDVWASLPLITSHNLNASDALYLRQALQMQMLLRMLEHDLVLVASDQRLLRAAQTEGLLTVNPEMADLADIATLL
jgi:predicted nucleic acid-binding protein